MQQLPLAKVWKDKNTPLATKIRVLQTLIFPIVSYGAECWVLKTSDRKGLQSFQMWCYRRVLRISWTEKITNEEVLEKINCERQLINILDSTKLTFIGHQLRKEYTLEKILLLGSVYVKRLRGRPKTRLSDNIKEICGLSMVETERKAQERTDGGSSCRGLRPFGNELPVDDGSLGYLVQSNI